MKVELDVERGACSVVKEAGDPRFSGDRNAAGESRLLYHVKKHLNRQGFDFIKKRMAKDGHLVDDMQQYLRSRKPPYIAIVNSRWTIEGADTIFNREGEVTLTVHNI